MKISFDFDETLTEEFFQQIAKIFILSGHDVHIVTSRFKNWYIEEANKKIYNIANELGISKDNIHFTEGCYKYKFLKENNFDLHFDNMEDEVILCNMNGVNAVLIGLNSINSLKYLFDENSDLNTELNNL